MKHPRVALAAALLASATLSHAHRLDEYLQATTIAVEKDRVDCEIVLTPGVAILPVVLAAIDRDANGSISTLEQADYTVQVLRDLSLTADGQRLTLQASTTEFPSIEDMREGLGSVRIRFTARVPVAASHKLVLENHHLSSLSVYLVNALVPSSADLQIVEQNRNPQQSSYQLEYTQTGAPSGPLSLAWWTGIRAWLGLASALLLGRLAYGAIASRRKTAPPS